MLTAVAATVGASMSDSAESTPSPLPAGSALLTAGPNPDGESLAARVGGRLGVDERGCVVLDDGGNTWVAVWPAGWTADVDGGDVVVRSADGSSTVSSGDVVSAGGGVAPVYYFGVDTNAPCFPAGATELMFLQDIS